MPKIKTNKAAAKRFTLTKTGKVRRGKAYRSHILSSKTTKRKRNLRKTSTISAVEQRNVRKLIPYA
jgi:large subunit ribosomal protein L35